MALLPGEIDGPLKIAVRGDSEGILHFFLSLMDDSERFEMGNLKRVFAEEDQQLFDDLVKAYGDFVGRKIEKQFGVKPRLDVRPPTKPERN